MAEGYISKVHDMLSSAGMEDSMLSRDQWLMKCAVLVSAARVDAELAKARALNHIAHAIAKGKS